MFPGVCLLQGLFITAYIELCEGLENASFYCLYDICSCGVACLVTTLYFDVGSR